MLSLWDGGWSDGAGAANHLAITAHRYLQGWSVCLGVCAGSIMASGPYVSSQGQREGCSLSPRVPSQSAAAPGLALQRVVQTQARRREV